MPRTVAAGYAGSMFDLERLAPERLRLLRRSEYDQMVELGWFADEKVELLDGLLVSMSPSGAPHMEVIDRLNELLVLALKQRARVRVQGSFAAAEDSQPEPDVALIPRDDHSRAHPSKAYLVVEVSDSSLSKDRHVKSAIYSANGVPEYWIVNLVDDLIEVRTEPGDGGYARVTPYRRGERIALSAFPDVSVEVDAVLPTAGDD